MVGTSATGDGIVALAAAIPAVVLASIEWFTYHRRITL